MVPVVVTDDPKYVKEFLLKQDHLFASRPKNIASEHFTFGGNDIAFAPYGPHWKEVRRICLMELLSPKKIESFRQGRVEEVQCMVNDVYRASLEGKSINMRNLFGILTSNVITRMVLGQRFFGLKGASPEDIFAAGTDTSSITSEWAMAELLRHPEYMTKVREEIDVVVGHGHHVEESDLVHLRYLRAVVKEVFRLHPVGGFLIPHISMKDTKIKGFDIPKNTKVLINTYSLGRNPKVWSNPNDFDPKRFITNDKDCVEFNDPDCKIVPFGAGRRGCPGATLGMKVVLLCLARLIHLFNWSPLYKEKLEDSDMVEVLGYTIKSVPLEANAKPRLGSLLL
ncbi:hypothetical protein SUGI_0762530 [Cryptomeria japonica]|nr:hypothetical protein SUGI_0762530 [Cryptomeria japonica]